MTRNRGEDVGRMLSDPRAAILSMAVPLLIGFVVSRVQLFVDSYWCSGLGSEAVAAVNISGVIYWLVVDSGVGIGVGVSTAVARSLGAGDRERAASFVSQGVVFSAVFAVLVGFSVYAAAGPLLMYMNDTADIALCMEYAVPNLIFALPLVMNGILIGTLRGEGAARKSSQASVICSVANMVLDPILIYGAGMGIAGAAYATCFSYTLSTAVILAWYFRGSTYLGLRLRGFRFVRDQLYEILYVGLPHMCELLLPSLLVIPQNAIVVRTGGEAGVVCSMLPWKYVMLSMIPITALSSAMVPVASAALGQKDMAKAEYCYRFTGRLVAGLGLAMFVLLLVFAGPLSYVFTSSGDMVQYHDEFVKVIRIYAMSTLWLGLMQVASAMLQTMRFAQLGAVSMFVRESLFILFYWVGGMFWGMDGIYWGLFFGEIAGALLMIAFAMFALKVRRRENGGRSAVV